MQTTFTDLSKKTKQVMRALRRKQTVTVWHDGKPTAVLQAVDAPDTHAAVPQPTSAHPAFGLWADRQDMSDPAALVRTLRQGRLRAL